MKDKLNRIIEERLRELRQEKETWLYKLQYNENNDFYKASYLESIARINELLNLQEKLLEGETNE